MEDIELLRGRPAGRFGESGSKKGSLRPQFAGFSSVGPYLRLTRVL